METGGKGYQKEMSLREGGKEEGKERQNDLKIQISWLSEFALKCNLHKIRRLSSIKFRD
jgi:hypothetical protein